MDYVPGYIGLKITNVPSWANCISIMRKYSSSSIAEIRNCIDQNAYILLSPSINTSGIKKIRKCYDELLKNNISAEIYEQYETEELISRQLLSNLIDSHSITDKEVNDAINSETE
ncbi:MAG: hypothetical protein Q4A15_04645 [Prevotellaceae bacterium]|nr:hypothetical protein [Prevotellaceae bacterium]